MNKTSEDFFKKIYLSLNLKEFACERELESEQNCNILTPTLMVISVVPFRSRGLLNRSPGAYSAECRLPLPRLVSNSSYLQLNRGSQRPLQPGGGFLYYNLSTNSSVLQLTDFLSTPSYTIVQSPTQSLEWHV